MNSGIKISSADHKFLAEGCKKDQRGDGWWVNRRWVCVDDGSGDGSRERNQVSGLGPIKVR